MIIRVVQNRNTAQREPDLFIMSNITAQIGRHKILLPINHKNYNFQERKNSQVMTERDNLNDWSIELSDNKLSDNNLASELVENSSFFLNQSIEEIVIMFNYLSLAYVTRPTS